MFRKLTPILVVDAIEPCLPFWTERLGFNKTTEVPDGDKLGFVILEKDGIEVMYQTLHSAEGDVKLSFVKRGSTLFIETTDIDGIEKAMNGAEIAVPRRRTFYGADELFVREPGGNLVGFAQFGG